MNIFPAIDLYGGQAVRLYKGDYQNMTIYSSNPVEIALDFQKKGAKYLHLVDLEGAKSGNTPNLDTIINIKKQTSLFTEVGGGIRSIETIDTYLSNGIDRVILGTAAVTDEAFLREAVAKYGKMVAVGIDIKDGFVAIKGWTEKSNFTAYDFFDKMQEIGVTTVICTDISKDGAMEGTNHDLYKTLGSKYKMDIIASGGVSSLNDIKALRAMNLYGAIIGKAYYTGAIDLAKAIEVSI